jgi:hypothetical protein
VVSATPTEAAIRSVLYKQRSKTGESSNFLISGWGVRGPVEYFGGPTPRATPPLGVGPALWENKHNCSRLRPNRIFQVLCLGQKTEH